MYCKSENKYPDHDHARESKDLIEKNKCSVIKIFKESDYGKDVTRALALIKVNS